MTPLAFSPPGQHRLALILPAAGASTRIGGDVRKPFIELRGRPVICHTLRQFRGINGLEQIVVAVHPDDLARARSSYWRELNRLGATNLVAGGASRQESVAKALKALHEGVDLVIIHDAVRPFVPRRAIEESITAAVEHGAAVVAVPMSATVKRAQGELVAETIPRDGLWMAQTPQVFRKDLIARAFAEAARAGFEGTDDAQLVERLGVPVRIVPGSYENFKITTPDHLRMAEALLALAEGQ